MATHCISSVQKNGSDGLLTVLCDSDWMNNLNFSGYEYIVHIKSVFSVDKVALEMWLLKGGFSHPYLDYDLAITIYYDRLQLMLFNLLSKIF